MPGDRVFVPAGLPHAIGDGILLVELQEPSDLSVLLEWTGFASTGGSEGTSGSASRSPSAASPAARSTTVRSPTSSVRLSTCPRRAPA